MSQFREYTVKIRSDGANISIISTYGSNQLSSVVAQDGLEDTNFGAACVAHKNAFFSLPASSTSPPCTVSVSGRWVQVTAGGTPTGDVTTLGSTINVPVGNSGDLILYVEAGDFTAQYKINAGSFTTFTDATTINVNDGDVLYFKSDTAAAQETMNGSVVDSDTARTVDAFSLLNSSSAP